MSGEASEERWEKEARGRSEAGKEHWKEPAEGKGEGELARIVLPWPPLMTYS